MIIKSQYDSRYYLVGYGIGCFSSSFRRYLNGLIVVNLGTDFDVDTWDQIVLQDDDETCNIVSVERADSDTTLERAEEEDVTYFIPQIPSKVSCQTGFVFRNNQCISYTADCQNSFGGNVIGISSGDGNSTCYCSPGYQWNGAGTTCISVPQAAAPQENPKPITAGSVNPDPAPASVVVKKEFKLDETKKKDFDPNLRGEAVVAGNVRKCPSTEGCAITSSLKPKTQVSILGSYNQEQWFEVSVGGITGWAHSSIVHKLPKNDVPSANQTSEQETPKENEHQTWYQKIPSFVIRLFWKSKK